MAHNHDPATRDVIRSSGLAGAIPASPPHAYPHGAPTAGTGKRTLPGILRDAPACAQQWDAWCRYVHGSPSAYHWQAVLFAQVAAQITRPVMQDLARQGYVPTWTGWRRLAPAWCRRLLVLVTRGLGPDLSHARWRPPGHPGARLTYRFVLCAGTVPTLDRIYWYGSSAAAIAERDRNQRRLAVLLLLLVLAGSVGQVVVSFWCALLTLIGLPLLAWHGLAFVPRGGSRICSVLLLLGMGLLGMHWLSTGMQVIQALTALLSRMGGSSVHDIRRQHIRDLSPAPLWRISRCA